MCLFEEPHAASYGVGDPSADQLALKNHAVVMIAVQDRHLAERHPLFGEVENLLAEEVGLLVNVRRGDRHRLHPRFSRRDQILGEAQGVLGDRGVGEGDDLGGRAVVDVEVENPRARMSFRELEDVVVVGTSEAVNRLCVVSDSRQIPRTCGGDRLDDRDLHRVGVLRLIDQDVTKPSPLDFALLGKVVEQAGPLVEQVVIVHAIGRELAASVNPGDLLDGSSPLAELRHLFVDQLSDRTAKIRRVADQVVNGRRLRAHFPGAEHSRVVHRQLDEISLVGAVEDREIRAVAEQLGRLPQEPIADMVKRSRPNLLGLRSDQGFQAMDHLPSGPASKRH